MDRTEGPCWACLNGKAGKGEGVERAVEGGKDVSHCGGQRGSGEDACQCQLAVVQVSVTVPARLERDCRQWAPSAGY